MSLAAQPLCLMSNICPLPHFGLIPDTRLSKLGPLLDKSGLGSRDPGNLRPGELLGNTRVETQTMVKQLFTVFRQLKSERHGRNIMLRIMH